MEERDPVEVHVASLFCKQRYFQSYANTRQSHMYTLYGGGLMDRYFPTNQKRNIVASKFTSHSHINFDAKVLRYDQCRTGLTRIYTFNLSFVENLG